ncbi:MAG: outer membrane protein assembly factor BamD [Nitrospinota bacterium]|nr:outer membrane protein assembly factor BamD [Nitrospinota bacterium]
MFKFLNSHTPGRLGRALGLALATAAAFIHLSGCVEFKKEMVADDSLLLNKANNFFARSRFNQATDSYRKLVEGYPDSSYKKVGLIGLADSLYKEGQFEEADLYYSRFVELYPLDEMTPRALFYYGMSQVMLTSTPDRSQTKTKTAINVFDEFTRRYPDNNLTPSAAWHKKQMEAMLAESKLEVARFYHRTGRNAAAINRLREFLEENPATPDAPEAMFLLGECLMREQAYKRAAEVFTVLIGAHPDSPWALKARATANKLILKAG